MQVNAHHLDKDQWAVIQPPKILVICIETFVLCTVLFALLFVIFYLFIDI